MANEGFWRVFELSNECTGPYYNQRTNSFEPHFIVSRYLAAKLKERGETVIGYKNRDKSTTYKWYVMFTHGKAVDDYCNGMLASIMREELEKVIMIGGC